MTSAQRKTPILFVHWGDEGIRGSERVLLDLLARLDRNRFSALLWCNAETMGHAARELDVPVRVSRMPILLGWDAPKFDFAGYGALIRQGKNLIGELEARLVHANSGAPNQWMVPAARAARIPLLAHLHAIYGFRDRCTLLLHQVPLIVGCSEAVAKPFRSDGFPDSRLRVIHNGVEPNRLNTGDARNLRRSLGIGENAILVVSVGALVTLKGLDVIIRAVHRVVASGIDAHLAIVGEGPEREQLVTLADDLGVADRIHFLGAQEAVGAILRDAADLVAVGSRIESFGLVAAEAAAVGRAVVGTRVGGMPEVVAEGKTGILVPSDDVVQFADALARLATNQKMREQLGAAARERFLEHFTAARAASSFERLYLDMVSKPSVEYSWLRLGFRIAPFARLGSAIIRRRLRAKVSDN